jgi:predicted DNA-binding protein YlxM (UPF0122 family)
MNNEAIEEIFTEDCVKQSKQIHPTLNQVRKKLQGFDEALIMYTYHKMNGRFKEAFTYLEEFNEQQEELNQNLRKLNSQPMIEENGLITE